MTVAETWKAIAIALGNAMQNHAYCEDHEAEEPEASCPFCSDREVYNRYRTFAQKNGVMFPNPMRGATSMTLSDIRRST